MKSLSSREKKSLAFAVACFIFSVGTYIYIEHRAVHINASASTPLPPSSGPIRLTPIPAVVPSAPPGNPTTAVPVNNDKQYLQAMAAAQQRSGLQKVIDAQLVQTQMRDYSDNVVANLERLRPYNPNEPVSETEPIFLYDGRTK